jgi:hypothetical protein
MVEHSEGSWSIGVAIRSNIDSIIGDLCVIVMSFVEQAPGVLWIGKKRKWLNESIRRICCDWQSLGTNPLNVLIVSPHISWALSNFISVNWKKRTQSDTFFAHSHSEKSPTCFSRMAIISLNRFRTTMHSAGQADHEYLWRRSSLRDRNGCTQWWMLGTNRNQMSIYTSIAHHRHQISNDQWSFVEGQTGIERLLIVAPNQFSAS